MSIHPALARIMASTLPLTLTLACSEPPTAVAPAVEIAPAAVEVADAPLTFAAAEARAAGPATAADAIEDALARVLPALEEGGATEGLEAGLRELQARLDQRGKGSRGLEQALTEVQKAVDRYQAQAGEAYQPDVSALQLALDAAAQS